VRRERCRLVWNGAEHLRHNGSIEGGVFEGEAVGEGIHRCDDPAAKACEQLPPDVVLLATLGPGSDTGQKRAKKG
jgi:hypothetical protein